MKKVRRISVHGALCNVVEFNEDEYTNNGNKQNLQLLLMNGRLTKDELAFLGFFQNFIHYPENTLVINMKNPTIEEMSNYSELNRNSLSSTLKSLEDRQIVKVLRIHKLAPVIYFNPFLYLSSNGLLEDVYELFKGSYFNPILKISNQDLIQSIKSKIKLVSDSSNILKKDYESDKENNRNSPEYREWRAQVVERDGYKCALCGSEEDIHAHHKDAYKWSIENRINVDNGVTLCKLHHKLFHSIYGRGTNTSSQYYEYEKIIKATIYVMEEIDYEKSMLNSKEGRINEMIQSLLQLQFAKGYQKGQVDLVEKLISEKPKVFKNTSIELSVNGNVHYTNIQDNKRRKIASNNAIVETLEDMAKRFGSK